MKKILFTLLAALATTSVLAKDETLLTDLDIWKLYTRPELSITEIADSTTSIFEIGVGAQLNDKLALGPAFGVSLREIDTDDGDIDRFDLWHAGLRADYTFHASKLYHASAALLIGGGSVKVQEFDTAGYFLVEPSVNGAANIWDDVELGITLGYRHTDGAETGDLDDGDFSGLKLGIFVRVTEL